MAEKGITRQAIDFSTHGGVIFIGNGQFTINGVKTCVNGDIHHCPIFGHGNTPVSATTLTTFSGGKKVIKAGDLAGCGAIMTGSPTVTIGS